MADIRFAPGRDQVEKAVDLSGQSFFQKTDREGWRNLGGLHLARIGHEGDVVDFQCGPGAHARFSFDAEKPSCDRRRSIADFEFGAPQSAQEFGERGFFADRQAKISELTVDGRGRSIADSGNATSIEIEHGERFQHIVELAGSKGDRDILVAVDGSLVFEIADAVLVENDAFDGKSGILRLQNGGAQKRKRKNPESKSRHDYPLDRIILLFRSAHDSEARELGRFVLGYLGPVTAPVGVITGGCAMAVARALFVSSISRCAILSATSAIAPRNFPPLLS